MFGIVLKNVLGFRKTMSVTVAVSQGLPMLIFITYSSWAAERERLSGHPPMCLDYEVINLHSVEALGRNSPYSRGVVIGIPGSEFHKIHTSNYPF